jgi:hypothetical protein
VSGKYYTLNSTPQDPSVTNINFAIIEQLNLAVYSSDSVHYDYYAFIDNYIPNVLTNFNLSLKLHSSSGVQLNNTGVLQSSGLIGTTNITAYNTDMGVGPFSRVTEILVSNGVPISLNYVNNWESESNYQADSNNNLIVAKTVFVEIYSDSSNQYIYGTSSN